MGLIDSGCSSSSDTCVNNAKTECSCRSQWMLARSAQLPRKRAEYPSLRVRGHLVDEAMKRQVKRPAEESAMSAVSTGKGNYVCQSDSSFLPCTEIGKGSAHSASSRCAVRTNQTLISNLNDLSIELLLDPSSITPLSYQARYHQDTDFASL